MDGQSWEKWVMQQSIRAAEAQSFKRVVQQQFFAIEYMKLNMGPALELNLSGERLCCQLSRGQRRFPR